MLFYLCGQVHIPPMLCKHGRVCDAKGALVSAGRNMKQIDIRFNLLRNTDTFLQIVSFLHKF